MTNNSNRLLALKVLLSLDQKQGSLSSLLDHLNQSTPDANHALIRELVYGTCRWFHRLEFYGSRLLEKPLRSRDRDIHLLILLGIYQLFYMRIPDHAAINETVALTKALKKDWAKGLVNAVLRRAQREQEALELAAQASEATRYSHPGWLLKRLKKDWPDHYTSILDGNNIQAPMTLRVNLSRIPRAQYLESLGNAGIKATPGQYSESAVILDSPCDVRSLPGFDEGLVSVQDEASQLSAVLLAAELAAEKEARVLDACAAPGGKTCALLEHAAGRLAVTALDNNETRLGRVTENLARLGLEATTQCADAASPQDWWDKTPFDAILLDAPCTGTGVIRRHPDIKLLRNAGDLDRLCSLQQRLLSALWPLLAPGGVLLYSTCSVLKQENERQISGFLASTPDARPSPLSHPLAVTCSAGIQFHPGVGNMDGFYYARLEKC